MKFTEFKDLEVGTIFCVSTIHVYVKTYQVGHEEDGSIFNAVSIAGYTVLIPDRARVSVVPEEDR